MSITNNMEELVPYNYAKGKDENEFAFIWRLGEAKTSGIIDLTWDEIADIINSECREDALDYRGESSYRKQYTVAKQFYDSVFVTEDGSTAPPLRIQDQLDEIYKAKRKFYDQRRTYNKELIQEARAEHLTSELIKAAQALGDIEPVAYTPAETDFTESEGVLFLSDWHFGLVADNVWNTFNPEVCKARIDKLVADTITTIKRHKPSILHIAILGDMVNGVLRPVSQIEASENGCDQIMSVSEMLANVVATLAGYVSSVLVYSTWGNHGRTVQRYVDSIYEDNMERIIPWWMKQRLSKVTNVTFVDSDSEFVRITACGFDIAAVHGDLDTKKDLPAVATAVFNKLYGTVPSYVAMGHVHHNSSMDNLGIEAITVGSLSGTDSYANGKRLYATPSQTLLYFNRRDGKECRYDILFRE